MTTRLAGTVDPVPAVQPGPRDGGRATRRTRTAIARRTCGSRCGSGTPGSTCCSGSSTSSRPPKGSKARPVVIFPRYHQWDAVLRADGRRPRARCRARLPGAALGRVGQVEHDRLAGPPAVVAARRRRHEGVRQGRRDHRPAGARPPAAGHDLPVRARPRRRGADRRELPAARRRPRRRAGPDHHHDAAEVPVRHSTRSRRCRSAGTP